MRSAKGRIYLVISILEGRTVEYFLVAAYTL